MFNFKMHRCVLFVHKFNLGLQSVLVHRPICLNSIFNFKENLSLFLLFIVNYRVVNLKKKFDGKIKINSYGFSFLNCGFPFWH